MFPDKIDTFVDLFCGGCNVGINVKANKIICNDIVYHIINMFKSMKNTNATVALNKVHSIINTYDLNTTNKEGFKKLRNNYNNGKTEWYYFYTLVAFSFNHQFRFNNNHKYNSSFGGTISSYKKITEQNLIKFINRISELNIYFTSLDYNEYNLNFLSKNDFIYCDPPYSITTGNYNDGKRGFKGWNKQDDVDLFNLLDTLNNKNIKFALSNVLKNKGKSNDILKNWSKKYNIHHLNNSYGNSIYNAKNKNNNTTDEVLITNY